MSRIALIHATPIAVEPIHAAFCALWPEARPIDIMDYSLSPDREAAGSIDEGLTRRIGALASYAISTGAAAVLFTCSAFGSAIELAASQSARPVLKPNEAMFQAAIASGQRIAMICPFAPAAGSMQSEFRDEAARQGSKATLETVLAPGAIEAIRAGDIATHNRIVAGKAAGLRGFDAIVLAHFSTARALDRVRQVTDLPVFASPQAAVEKLRHLVLEDAPC